jgi:hypothetical protein
MKWSKKQQAKWDKKNMEKSNGHAVNNLEQEQDLAWERLRKKLEQPETLAVFKRMKDR